MLALAILLPALLRQFVIGYLATKMRMSAEFSVSISFWTIFTTFLCNSCSIRKRPPDCGTSHQGRRNTMAQPVSPAVGAFEFMLHTNTKQFQHGAQWCSWRAKVISTNCLVTNLNLQWYVGIGALHRVFQAEPYLVPMPLYSLKFLAMQCVTDKSCSKSFGKAKIWGYGGPLFVADKSMGDEPHVSRLMDITQEVSYPIRTNLSTKIGRKHCHS